MFYDVLIVGAGPAGSSAAKAAARAAAKVLLVEKREVIGRPVRCAEFVPRMLAETVALPPACVAREVSTTKVYLPGGEERTFNSPGFILDRARFDQMLAREAQKEGTRVWVNTSCIGRDGDEVTLKRGREEISVAAKVVVGADGPRSTVASWINEANVDFVVARQYEMPLASPMDGTEIYFTPELFGGYGWLFPKKETANVGVGVRLERGRRPALQGKLDAFVKRLARAGKVGPEPLAVTAGLIPVGGPGRTVAGNVILVGDAAGQTHAITGGGIPQAVVCGEVAGRVAAAAARDDNLGLLSRYEDEWREIYGDELSRAKRRRELLEAAWSDLDNVLKRCWVSFPEYYD